MSGVWCDWHDRSVEDGEECPDCHSEYVMGDTHDPYECEYEHCPTCRQHWMDEKADQQTRKE